MNHDAEVWDLNKSIKTEFMRTMLGKKLGQGVSRRVFELAFNLDMVVKIETNSGSFQNVMEWETWKDVQNFGKWSRWFAPCVEISPCGMVLLQKRAKPLPEDFSIPKLPSFLCDLKPSNFGLIGRQVVAVDYGLSNLARKALRSARLVAITKKQWAT